MTKLGTAAFKGASGHKFEFGIYPLGSKMKTGHGGVYVITSRRVEEQGHHKHHKIFVGETEDLSSVLANHPQQSSFETQGANCICIHATQDGKARSRIVQDLKAGGIPGA
jgi:hypothetical protein